MNDCLFYFVWMNHSCFHFTIHISFQISLKSHLALQAYWLNINIYFQNPLQLVSTNTIHSITIDSWNIRLFHQNTQSQLSRILPGQSYSWLSHISYFENWNWWLIVKPFLTFRGTAPCVWFTRSVSSGKPEKDIFVFKILKTLPWLLFFSLLPIFYTFAASHISKT